MIPVGAAAPDFQLADQNNQPFRLGAWRGRANVLLFFIPAAFTPICGTELPALDAQFEAFGRQASTVPVVVTPDNCPTNLAWARQYGGRRVRLLSDWLPHGAVSRAYGAWIGSEAICDRASVLVGRDGLVRYAESVGKFGKRSVPRLLEIAAACDGRAPPPRGVPSARMALDLPVVYLTTTCEHCARVAAFLAATGLAERVVTRAVDRDPAAMNELLGYDPGGNVPLLVYRNRAIPGDEAIIAALRRVYRLAA